MNGKISHLLHEKEIANLDKEDLLACIAFLEKKLSECEEQADANQELAGRYRQVFMQSPAVWLIVDPVTGAILSANEAAVVFYGYTIQELKSMNIFQINTDERQVTRERMANRAACETTVPFAAQHRLKNGEIRAVQVYSGPFETGERTLLSSIIVDITAKQQAEEELQKSRDRLAIVIEGTKAGVWEWDAQTGKVFYDDNWKSMLGYGPEEKLDVSDGWKSYCCPEDIEKIQQAAKDYIENKAERYEVEYRILHKSGSYRWFRAIGKALFDKDRRPVRWVGSTIDIEEQKRIEELKKESVLKIREFSQVVSDAGFIVDEDGILLEVFGDREDLFFVAKDRQNGRSLFEVIPQYGDIFIKEIQMALSAGKRRSLKTMMNYSEGQRFFIIRTAPMSYVVNGKRTAAVALFDITEQEKIRRMLMASYKMRRRSDLLNDIASRTRRADEETLASLKNYGILLDVPFYCCIIQFSNALIHLAKTAETFAGVHQIKDEILNELNGIKGCVTWEYHEGMGLICYFDGLDFIKSSRKIGQRISSIVEKFGLGLEYNIGIGEPAFDLPGFVKSVQQAREAVQAAKCEVRKQQGQMLYYRDMGILQLLSGNWDGEHAAEFVERTIGKLIRYDWEKGTDYLSTLEVLLQSSSMKETAQQLFLHHNTLAFRKRRIEKILGASVSDFEVKLTLAAAIKIYRLIMSK